jgi:hypothetical protein
MPHHPIAGMISGAVVSLPVWAVVAVTILILVY